MNSMNIGKEKVNSDRQKGFTLVELIVVLVIVAILAALAVPALIGFIDSSKDKSVIANARMALSSTQAALSDIYSSNDNCYDTAKREATRVKAGAGSDTAFTVWNVKTLWDTKIGENPETNAVSEQIGSYTVGKAVYKEDEHTFAAYDGTDWVIYGSYTEATNAIGVSNDDENIIYVWPYTLYSDYAYREEVRDPDREYDNYAESKEPEKTKTVILKIDRQSKSRFVAELDATNKQKKIMLTFTLFNDDSIECDGWVPDETETNRFLIGGILLKLMMPSDIYRFATWEDEEGEGTFTEPVSMGRYVFSDKKADEDTVTFFAKLDVGDSGKTATLDKDLFTKFLNDSNTALYKKSGTNYGNPLKCRQTTAVTRVNTESFTLDDFNANPTKYRKVDDGSTDCNIYVWYDSSTSNTLYWWSDAMEKTEEDPEEHVFMPVDCSNLLAMRNFTTFDFTGFNMHKVRTTANMFDHCDNLTSMNFGESFSAPDLTDMSGMFQFCRNYENPNLEGIISVGKTVDISRMFYNMDKVGEGRTGQEYASASAKTNAIHSINFGHFLDYRSENEEGETILTKVTACEQIFSGLNHITSLDLSTWNVSEIKSCYGMCAWCQNLEHIRFSPNPEGIEDAEDEGWYMPEVTDMSFMFYECDKIIDGNFIGKLRSGPKLETMSNAFCKMDNVEVIDLSGIDPTSLANIESMVRLDKNLKTLKLEAWRGRAKSINRMKQTFQDCNSLLKLDMGYWNVNGISEADYLRNDGTFQNLNSLEYIDISGWHIDKVDMPTGVLTRGTIKTLILNDAILPTVTKLDLSNHTNLVTVRMNGFKAEKMTSLSFKECASLEEADLSDLDAGLVTGASSMFAGCVSLKSDRVHFTKDTLKNVTNVSWMFSRCSSLTNVDFLKDWDMSQKGSFEGMFYSCAGLTKVDFKGYEFEKVSSFKKLFNGCTNLTELDISDWRITSTNLYDTGEVFNGCTGLVKINAKNWYIGVQCAKHPYGMFSTCPTDYELNISGSEICRTGDLKDLFKNHKHIKKLNMSGFKDDAEGCSRLDSMFEGCTALKEVDFTGCSFANATAYKNFFKGCTGLENLAFLKTLNVPSVDNMSFMFTNCTGLTDLASINKDFFANAKEMNNIFQGCTGLADVDASGWNLEKVNSMTDAFSGCTAMTSLDISGWSMGTSVNIKNMFSNCSMLTKIYASGALPYSSQYTSMFSGCNLLQGGNGTKYSTASNNDQARYACIDADGTPGYFTQR